MTNNGYLGEIRIFAGNFAPEGWAFCEGQLMPISEYDALFNLIGTTYGGDGESTFAMPDLRGRLPIGQDPENPTQPYQIGETGGAEEVTLSINQIPVHTHPWLTTGDRSGTSASPAGARLAQSTSITPYTVAEPESAMAAAAVSPTGGSQPHTNLQPYLCVNFIISLFGVFPSQT
jgi:microcystin-dependent protein